MTGRPGDVVAALGGLTVVRTRRAFAVRFEDGTRTEDMTKRAAIGRMDVVAGLRAAAAEREAAGRELLAEWGIGPVDYRDLAAGDLFTWSPSVPPKTVTEARHLDSGASLILWADGHTPAPQAMTLMTPRFPAAYGVLMADTPQYAEPMADEPGRVNTPRTGDRYTWRNILIEVGAVDPGGAWAMIHCTIAPRPELGPYDGRRNGWEWDKQQPTPEGTFPAGWEPVTGDAATR